MDLFKNTAYNQHIANGLAQTEVLITCFMCLIDTRTSTADERKVMIRLLCQKRAELSEQNILPTINKHILEKIL
jgi:hypothetical protein